MRKKIIFCSIITLFSVINMAQGQEFFGGVIAGFSGCQVGGDGLSGYKKFGISGGGFVGLKFTPTDALRLELEYSQKGSRETPSDNLEDAANWMNFKITEHCIDLPILYQYFFCRWASLEVGFSGTYLISLQETTWQEQSGSGDEMPVSLNIVAGAYFHVNDHFFINLRTSNGLTPFRKTYDNLARRRLGFGQFNDLLTLTIGWDFGKGAIDQK